MLESETFEVVQLVVIKVSRNWVPEGGLGKSLEVMRSLN